MWKAKANGYDERTNCILYGSMILTSEGVQTEKFDVSGGECQCSRLPVATRGYEL